MVPTADASSGVDSQKNEADKKPKTEDDAGGTPEVPSDAGALKSQPPVIAQPQTEDDAGALETWDFKVVSKSGTYGPRAAPYPEIDTIKGVATKTHAKVFCTNHDMPISVSYSVALYGERAANILANEWVRKMQHFYDVYLEEAPWHFDPRAAEARYEEDPVFTDFYQAERRRPKKHINEAIWKIREMVPRVIIDVKTYGGSGRRPSRSSEVDATDDLIVF